MTFKEFILAAFSDNGQPSSARILGAWLSVSSMALIWFMVRHAFYLEDNARLQTWIGGLPLIIGALATFAISPYGVSKIASMFKKDAPQGDKG
jgi:hypothetical protein